MGESKFPTLVVLLLMALGLAARLLWRNRLSKESAVASLDPLELADLSLTSYFTHLYRRPHQVLGLAPGPLDYNTSSTSYSKYRKLNILQTPNCRYCVLRSCS
jgi:hypothetical protein